MSGPAHQTPLHDAHAKLGARLVDFHGWIMPIQYTGILEEHAAVRSRVGLFDLSHMGRVRVRGAARRAFLQKLLTIDVDKVSAGRCRYTFLLTERGTIIDDLIFYADPAEDLLVINASNREKDLEWMRRHAPAGVELDDQTFKVSLLAVQGPESLATVQKALGIDPGGLGYYTSGTFGGFLVSRTGYTGEDGFEIFLPAERAVETWDRLIAAGVPPIGLGARDTLRTEAAMPLYGNELDDTITPIDAGLDFALEMGKPDFLGKAALASHPVPPRKRVGLVLDSKRIGRHGYEVSRDGAQVGIITSGTFSHSLGKSIAMAYVARETSEPGETLDIDVRGRTEKAIVVKLPFYRRKKS